MKRISACLLLSAATATVAAAQNYSTAGADTNATIVVTSTNYIALNSSNAVQSLTLADCIDLALKHNFDLQIVRYDPRIALYTLYGAYGGWDPTLNASGQHNFNVTGGGLDQNQLPLPSDTSDRNSFNAGIGGLTPWGLTYDFSGNIAETYGQGSSGEFDSSGGSIGVDLKQPLLKNFWMDSTREAIYVDRNRFKYSEQSLRQQLITTISAVENAYYELIYAQENVNVQVEALQLAEQQLSDDRRRVEIQVLAERGGTIEQDESQVAQSRSDLLGAENTLSGDENILKNLITDNYPKWHEISIQPADHLEAVQQLFDLQDSWSQGLTLRPDILQDKLNVEQQGIQLKYTYNQLYPELDLVGSYGFNGQSREFAGTFGNFREGNEPFYSYGAQLTMPLVNIGAHNSYKSGKATKQQSLLQLKQLEQTVMVTIDSDVSDARSKWETLDATRLARVYAEVALSAEQGKYAAGKSTTFTVLQLQSKVTTARSQEVRSLADYNEALSKLAVDEGSTLRHRNIDIEVK